MRSSRILRSRLREQFVVTLKPHAGGDSFSGVLYSEDGKSLVLRNAAAVGAGENKTDLPLDGELIVLLADIAFLQRP